MSKTNTSTCQAGYEQPESYLSTDLISQIAPTDYCQNNASLFKLARMVKSYENAVGRMATQEELELVFDRWSAIATDFWTYGLTRDDYYAEFLELYGYARTGLNPIEVALSRAKAGPLPEVQGFTDECIRLLAAICREMQKITGTTPFFIPTRKLGKLLGVHYTRVARWLRAFEVVGIIRLAPGEIRRQGGNRCPRYYYGAPTQNSVGVLVKAPLSPSERDALPDGYQRTEAEGSTNCNPEVLLAMT
jgi:hypothetical protein